MLKRNLKRSMPILMVVIIISAVCTVMLFISFGVQSEQSAWAGTSSPRPNGQIAFVSDKDGNNEIYVMNAADGSAQTRLTNNASSDDEPSWSPDGTKIAFTSTRDGNGEIYVMSADGTNPTRLTNNTANDFDPSWSPDGTKITFVSDRDRLLYNADIYLMNADGTNPTRLTNNTRFYESQPSWSPDGSKIAFVSDRDSWLQRTTEEFLYYNIYVMNAADGSAQTRLTNDTDFDDIDPSWSPDGTKIAFVSDRDDNYDIYVMNAADGSNVDKLERDTTGHDSNVEPSWSPDGTKIAFESNRDDDENPSIDPHRINKNIYVMNAADGSAQTRLTNSTAVDSSPSWGTNTSPLTGDSAA